MQDTQAPVEFDEPPSTVNATYVEPSATEPLAPGAKLGHLFALNATQPYYLQRLTERTYFFGGGFYTTTFYVGDEGVLVFDPPEGQGEHLLQAIAEVTSLPVTAIVYSHGHADHMIGAPAILAAASAAGVPERAGHRLHRDGCEDEAPEIQHAGGHRDGGVAEGHVRVRRSDRRAARLCAGRRTPTTRRCSCSCKSRSRTCRI